MNKDNGNDITYHNKDVVSKIFGESLKEKSLKIYGIDIPRIKEVLPTNLPTIHANELRIDNLFLLEDGSIAIIDYESADKKENRLKYCEYILRVLERYKEQGLDLRIRMIVIYTADVEKAEPVFSVGSLTLEIEQAFLSRMDTTKIKEQLAKKIRQGESLTDEEAMEFIVYPLAYKGMNAKQEAIKEAVELAREIQDKEEQTYILTGILVFADKVIDKETAERIKEAILMTKVAELLIEKGREEGREKGREEGREKGREELIMKALKNGMQIQEIVDMFEIPTKEVQHIAEKMIEVKRQVKKNV